MVDGQRGRGWPEACFYAVSLHLYVTRGELANLQGESANSRQARLESEWNPDHWSCETACHT